MIGERDCSHHVDPWPREDGIIGRCDVKDAELFDDVVWIRSDRKLNCARRTSFASVEFIEK